MNILRLKGGRSLRNKSAGLLCYTWVIRILDCVLSVDRGFSSFLMDSSALIPALDKLLVSAKKLLLVTKVGSLSSELIRSILEGVDEFVFVINSEGAALQSKTLECFIIRRFFRGAIIISI